MVDEAHGQGTRDTDVVEILRALRDASDGWSGDAVCINADAGEAAAQLIEQLLSTRPSLPAPGGEEIARIIKEADWHVSTESAAGLAFFLARQWPVIRRALSRPPENVDHRATEPAALRSAGDSDTEIASAPIGHPERMIAERRAITVIIPAGYDSAWDFLNDCGLESVPERGVLEKALGIIDTEAAFYEGERKRLVPLHTTAESPYRDELLSVSAKRSALENTAALIRAALSPSIAAGDSDSAPHIAGQSDTKDALEYAEMADNRLDCKGCPECVEIARSYLREAIARLRRIPVVSESMRHKVMTPEEYETSNIQGWHSVCRDFDNAGNVAIRYGSPFLSEHRTRQDTLEEAARIAANGCLVPPDGGSPTEAERLRKLTSRSPAGSADHG